MLFDLKLYKELALPPKELTFDEASLFWRLKLGEGMPSRDWHKPLDRAKSWHEIKLSLDKKLRAERTNSLFKKIYPSQNFIVFLLKKVLSSLKKAFFQLD